MKLLYGCVKDALFGIKALRERDALLMSAERTFTVSDKEDVCSGSVLVAKGSLGAGLLSVNVCYRQHRHAALYVLEAEDDAFRHALTDFHQWYVGLPRSGSDLPMARMTVGGALVPDVSEGRPIGFAREDL